MPLTIRAIDVGYGQTKFTYDVTDGKPSFRIFPSIVQCVKNEANEERLIKTPDIKNSTVRVKDRFYEVGTDASANSYNTGILSETFTKTPEYMALVLGALSLMKPVNVIDTLVLGLPVDYIKTKAANLKKIFVGKHVLPGKRSVLIKNVVVIAQPLGGYLEWLGSINNVTQEMKTLVIDPGFYTFDYIVVRNGKDIPSLNGSFPGGMSMLLEFVAEQISKKYNINYTNLRAIEEGIMKGVFRMYGKPVDLSPMMKPFQKETLGIIQRIINKIGDGRDIDQIVLVGGGSRMFYGAIKSIFNKHQLTVIDEPIMANVRGFQRYPSFIGVEEEA